MTAHEPTANRPDGRCGAAARHSALVNLAHLDHLGEDLVHDGAPLRIVHIYAKEPNYAPMADPVEGTACVDDAARAAVVYLRHYELRGDEPSRNKAEALVRFILYMQSEDGLFHNFVVDNRLEINREHFRSRADRLHWWTCRAVWALSSAASVLGSANPTLARECADAVGRTIPHIRDLLTHYPRTIVRDERTYPTWLVHGSAADATSELLLGLVAFDRVESSSAIREIITRLCEGLAIMRYGSMNTFPYGAHASIEREWHAWGNAQTQALAEAGAMSSALWEAEHFYPRLLAEGFLNSIRFDEQSSIRQFTQIAYGTRCVAVGLVRLFEATGDEKFLTMAGLAASWFTGNNAAGVTMFDTRTGRCHDGIIDATRVNRNAGAESTIEAVYTMIEMARFAEAVRWLHVDCEPPVRAVRQGDEILYRIFKSRESPSQCVAVVMELAQGRLQVLRNEEMASLPSG